MKKVALFLPLVFLIAAIRFVVIVLIGDFYKNGSIPSILILIFAIAIISWIFSFVKNKKLREKLQSSSSIIYVGIAFMLMAVICLLGIIIASYTGILTFLAPFSNKDLSIDLGIFIVKSDFIKLLVCILDFIAIYILFKYLTNFYKTIKVKLLSKN